MQVRTEINVLTLQNYMIQPRIHPLIKVKGDPSLHFTSWTGCMTLLQIYHNHELSREIERKELDTRNQLKAGVKYKRGDLQHLYEATLDIGTRSSIFTLLFLPPLNKPKQSKINVVPEWSREESSRTPSTSFTRVMFVNSPLQLRFSLLCCFF